MSIGARGPELIVAADAWSEAIADPVDRLGDEFIAPGPSREREARGSGPLPP